MSLNGDIAIEGTKKPGQRTWGHLPDNFVVEHRVAAGQEIRAGDIFTLNSTGLAVNFTTKGTGWNTADLSEGHFQALSTANNRTGSDGEQLVSAYGIGSRIELYAAAGVRVGDDVEISIPVQTRALPATALLGSRNKVKTITEARANTEASNAGVIGSVFQIISRGTTTDYGARRSVTLDNDLVGVIIGRNRHNA